MKKMMTLTLVLAFALQLSAMDYEQARERALFLTDKMAYELNLTDDQYEAAYEINLDYLMGVNTVDDVYGLYWERRNLDLSYVLLDWQYRAYLAASYFYRPLYWSAGVWHFGIYARYPYRDYFYFGRPHFYVTYRGAHAWHRHGGRSWYHGRTWASPGRGGHHFGMHDRFQRGDFGRGHRFGHSGHSGASDRPSYGGHSGRSDRGGYSGQSGNTRGSRFGGQSQPGISNGNSRATGSQFGGASTGSRSTFGSGRSTGSHFGSGRSVGRPSSGPSQHSGASFGGSSRSSSSSSFSGSSSSGSRSGGSFSGSHSGGSRSSSGHTSGSGHFGGRR